MYHVMEHGRNHMATRLYLHANDVNSGPVSVSVYRDATSQPLCYFLFVKIPDDSCEPCSMKFPPIQTRTKHQLDDDDVLSLFARC